MQMHKLKSKSTLISKQIVTIASSQEQTNHTQAELYFDNSHNKSQLILKDNAGFRDKNLLILITELLLRIIYYFKLQ